MRRTLLPAQKLISRTSGQENASISVEPLTYETCARKRKWKLMVRWSMRGIFLSVMMQIDRFLYHTYLFYLNTPIRHASIIHWHKHFLSNHTVIRRCIHWRTRDEHLTHAHWRSKESNHQTNRWPALPPKLKQPQLLVWLHDALFH